MWYCLDGKIKEQLPKSTDRRPTDFWGNCSSNLPFGPYVPTYHQRLTSRLGFWKLSRINLWLWWFCIRFSVVIEIYRGFSVLYRPQLSPPGFLESSLISFARWDSTLTWQRGHKRKRRWREGWEWFEGGDKSRDGYYSRKYRKQFLSWMP